MLQHKDRILVAIDTANIDLAKELSDKLQGFVGGIKLGLEFFNTNGHNGVRQVIHDGLESTPRGQACHNQPLFLDLKFHDIPNTVAAAVKSIMPLNPKIINVHISGGSAMMKAALDAASFAAESLGITRPMVIGVSVLTSMDNNDLKAVGQIGTTTEQVVRLAKLAKKNDLDGIVCSAREITAIRQVCGNDFKLIVPGIRPHGSNIGDQKRIMTPSDAVNAGADYLVIGRPITAAANPIDAIKMIIDDLNINCQVK